MPGLGRAERFNYGRLATVEAEASYGAGYTATGGDNILLIERAQIDREFMHDGARHPSWHGRGMLQPLGPGGHFKKVTITTHAGGPVNAWTAAIRPNIHRLLQGCGLTAVLDATVSAEKWTYTPDAYITPNSEQSLAMRVYNDGVYDEIAGAHGTFAFVAEGVGVPTWTFDFTGGHLAGPVDARLAQLPNVAPIPAAIPIGAGALCNIGTFLNARVRSFKFTQNRELHPRQDQSTPYFGFAGVVGGRMKGEWELLMEATAIPGSIPHDATGIWPYYMSQNPGYTFDLNYKTYSGGSYAPYRFEIPRATLYPGSAGFTIEEDGPITLWRLKGHGCYIGAGAANDFDWRLVFPAS